MIAYKNGHTEGVKELLKAGADVNKVMNNGDTLLMRASSHGQFYVVQQLLDAGANFDHQDRNGKTPLMHASDCGYHKVVLQLLKAGANKYLADKDGKTALMYASDDIVKELLEAGANKDLTALMYPSDDIVKEVLEAGANIDGAQRDLTSAKRVVKALENTLFNGKAFAAKGDNKDAPTLQKRDEKGITSLGSGEGVYKTYTSTVHLEVRSTLTTSSKGASPAASPAASGNPPESLGVKPTRTR